MFASGTAGDSVVEAWTSELEDAGGGVEVIAGDAGAAVVLPCGGNPCCGPLWTTLDWEERDLWCDLELAIRFKCDRSLCRLPPV